MEGSGRDTATSSEGTLSVNMMSVFRDNGYHVFGTGRVFDRGPGEGWSNGPITSWPDSVEDQQQEEGAEHGMVHKIYVSTTSLRVLVKFTKI